MLWQGMVTCYVQNERERLSFRLSLMVAVYVARSVLTEAACETDVEPGQLFEEFE